MTVPQQPRTNVEREFSRAFQAGFVFLLRSSPWIATACVFVLTLQQLGWNKGDLAVLAAAVAVLVFVSERSGARARAYYLNNYAVSPDAPAAPDAPRTVGREIIAKFGELRALHAYARAHDPTNHTELETIASALPHTGLPPFDLSDTRRARHEAGHVVAALVMDGAISSVDIRQRPNSDGATKWLNPIAPVQDQLWAQLVNSFAGRAVDLIDGHTDTSSATDIRNAIDTSVQLTSIGIAPSTYNGALDPSALLVAAAERATQIVAARPDALTRIADAIEHAHNTPGATLRDPDIRALL